VLAAAHVRLAALDLPPMPRSRLRQAALFALEDQVAASAGEAAVSITTTGRPVVAAIASRALVDAIGRSVPRAARIIPESTLAPHTAGWTWCASAAGDGFVRRADGSAFAVGSAATELPPELHAVLAQAKRGAHAPASVHAAFAVDPARLAAWSHAAGVPFVAAPEWRWEDAAASAFAQAPDFLAGDLPDVAPPASRIGKRFRPALVLATLAIGLHVVMLLAQWAWLGAAQWRLSRQIVAQATAAGLAAATPAAAMTGIARRNAGVRHAASQGAPADALPLLARAAPAIGDLPHGALKSARYGDGAWTLEVGKLDADALSHVTRALGRAGVEAVSAPSSSGTRMRITLADTAR